MKFAAQTYHSGQIPLWNPYLYAGTPAMGDPLYMAFSPVVLLFSIPSDLTMQFFDLVEILHILFGGICLYLFLRSLKVSML